MTEVSGLHASMSNINAEVPFDNRSYENRINELENEIAKMQMSYESSESSYRGDDSRNTNIFGNGPVNLRARRAPIQILD